MNAKTTSLIQTIGMYLMHLPLYILLCTINMPSDSAEGLTFGLIRAALILMILMIPVSIVNVVASIRSAIKEDYNLPKNTMVMKLSLIPWYSLNFAIGFICVSILFNPFMMIAIPVVIGLFVTSTYLLMLTTSIGDIAYFLHGKQKLTPAMILALVFLFLFFLDVIGAIILYKKSQAPVEQTLDPDKTADKE